VRGFDGARVLVLPETCHTARARIAAGMPTGTTAAARADREVRRILGTILVLNAAVAAGKLGYGVWTGALTIQADGVHSLLDSSANIVALWAVRVASAPPDREHPYGHRRFEAVGAMVIGVLIVLGGVTIGREAWVALRVGHHPAAGFGGAAMLAVVAGTNLVISTWEDRAGRRLGSALLVADAAHTRSDFYATLVALAATVGIASGHPWVDLPAAVVVLGLVVRAGVEVVSRELSVLVDRAPVDPETLERWVREVPGVRGCHKVRSRGSPHAVFVDLHIQVDPAMSIVDAHDVGGAVKAHLRERLPTLVDVLIHVEPDIGGSGGP